MITIGIDPGLSGGIAWIHDGKAAAEKMPETERDLLDLLTGIAREGPCFAVIEQVASSPQMGVVSAFTFGVGYGRLQMALTAAGIPYDRIRPMKWQTAMQCRTKGDKNVSKRRAQELFPAMKCTHAISDALLMAEYARRRNIV